MPREPQTPRNPNLKKKNCRCLPSHSAYTNTILLYSTRSVSTHGVGNCLVEINLPTLPLSCSRLESRRVNRSRSMVIRSSLPAYLSNILFDLCTSIYRVQHMYLSTGASLYEMTVKMTGEFRSVSKDFSQKQDGRYPSGECALY